MTASVDAPTTALGAAPAFVVRLDAFSGPLDLLLHLLREERLEIADGELGERRRAPFAGAPRSQEQGPVDLLVDREAALREAPHDRAFRGLVAVKARHVTGFRCGSSPVRRRWPRWSWAGSCPNRP